MNKSLKAPRVLFCLCPYVGGCFLLSERVFCLQVLAMQIGNIYNIQPAFRRDRSLNSIIIPIDRERIRDVRESSSRFCTRLIQ